MLRHLVSQHGDLLRPCGCSILNQSQQTISAALRTLEYQLATASLSAEGRATNRDLKTAMNELIGMMDNGPSPQQQMGGDMVVVEPSTPAVLPTSTLPPSLPQELPLPPPSKKRKKKSAPACKFAKTAASSVVQLPAAAAAAPVTTIKTATTTTTPWEAFINDPEVQDLINGVATD